MQAELRARSAGYVLVVLLAAGVLAACARAQRPALPPTRAPAAALAVKPAPPPVVRDRSELVYASVALRSPERLVREGLALLGPAVPSVVTPASVYDLLLTRALGLNQQVVQSLDLSRPAFVALADASRLGKRMRFAVLLPVADALGFSNGLAASPRVKVRSEPPFEPGGRPRQRLRVRGRRTFYLDSLPGYAVFTRYRDDFPGLRRRLLAISRAAPGSDVVVELEVQKALAPHRDKIGAAFLGLAAAGRAQDLGAVTQMASRYLGYLVGTERLTLSMDLDHARGIVFGAVAVAAPSGELRKAVQRQSVGPLWGEKYLPRGSVVVALGRRSPASVTQDVADTEQMITGFLRKRAPSLDASPLQRMLTEAARLSGDTYASSVSFTPRGGLTLSQASPVGDVKALRRLHREVWGWAQKSAWPLVVEAVQKGSKGRWRLGRLVRRSERLRGVPVEIVELGGQGPKKPMQVIRQVLGGPRLVLATGFADGVAFMAMGADARRRLGEMLAVHKGRALPSVSADPGFVEASQHRPANRTALGYVALIDAAQQMLRGLGPALGPKAAPYRTEVLAARGGQGITVATHADRDAVGMSVLVPTRHLAELIGLGRRLWQASRAARSTGRPGPLMPGPPTRRRPAGPRAPMPRGS